MHSSGKIRFFRFFIIKFDESTLNRNSSLDLCPILFKFFLNILNSLLNKMLGTLFLFRSLFKKNTTFLSKKGQKSLKSEKLCFLT